MSQVYLGYIRGAATFDQFGGCLVRDRLDCRLLYGRPFRPRQLSRIP